MSNTRQRERGDQRVAPQPPQFSSPDVAKLVLGDIQQKFVTYMTDALTYEAQSARKQGERAAKLAEIERLRAEIQQLEGDIARFDFTASTRKAEADGFGLALSALGQQPPTVSLPAQAQGGQENLGQQMANWNGPETGSFPLPDPFADNKADGYCINCRQQVWKADGTPRGATHGFGPTCDPNNPESTYADLGNVPAGGAVL